MALPVLAPGQRRVLTSYYCERCRMERADPFWQGIVTNLMQPGKLKATGKLASVSVFAKLYTIPDKTSLASSPCRCLLGQRGAQSPMHLPDIHM
jgi:hypothetical protein